jgi:hypothetical protein
MASPAKGARSNYIVVAVPQQSITTQSIASMTYNIQNSVRTVTDVVQEARDVLRNFRIYPNPNKGKEFFLEAKDFSNSELVTITIYDVSGKILQSTLTRADLNGSLNKLISISPKLSRGVFFIRVASRWRSLQHRLVVD